MNIEGKRELYKTAYHKTFGYVTLVSFEKAYAEYIWTCTNEQFGTVYVYESNLTSFCL